MLASWVFAAHVTDNPWDCRLVTPDALVMAATAHAPATYPDLAWHFAYNQGAQEKMLPALEQCPGFDLTGAVRLAWKRARLGLASQDELSLAAASEGLPEAITTAILRLERRLEAPEERRWLDSLRALTGYDGPPSKLRSWLLEHVGQFQFDPARKRYALTDKR